MSRIVITVLITVLLQTMSSAHADITLNYLDQNFCPQTSQQSGSSIRTNPLLHFKYLRENYFIQRRIVEGQKRYVLFTPYNRIELPTSVGEVRDFIIENDLLFLLTRNQIIEMTIKGKTIERFDIPNANNFKTYARGFSFSSFDNSLYLTQGKLGLRKFELNSRNFTSLHPLNTTNSSGHLSAAVSVVIENQTAYIAMTGRSEKGFNGIVTLNISNQNIINLSEYDKRRVGVVYPYASIYLNGESVFINNAGWIHEVEKNDVLNKKRIRPKWNAIAHDTENYRQYIMLKGDFIFSTQSIIGCGVYRTTNDQHIGKAFSYQRR